MAKDAEDMDLDKLAQQMHLRPALRLVSRQPTQRRGKQARKPQLRRERPAPCAQEATSSETGFLPAIRAAWVTGHDAYHQ
jgi:hypothetical protein